MLTQRTVHKFYQALSVRWPNVKTELEYQTPFQLLIAVVLSAQATDKSVNKVTTQLFKTVSSPHDIVILGEEKLKAIIRSIGLYNAKAKNLVQLSQQLIAQFAGIVPNNRAGLESLPGVGRKTANVVLNIIFDQPTIAVDTHIFRLCNRTKIAPGATPRAVEDRLKAVVPAAFKMTCHHTMIMHGRYICKARTPLCSQCCIRDVCQFDGKLNA